MSGKGEEEDEGMGNGEQLIGKKQKRQLGIHVDSKHITSKQVKYTKYFSNSTFYKSCSCCYRNLAERS